MRPQYGGLVSHWVRTMREWMTGVTQIGIVVLITVKRGPDLTSDETSSCERVGNWRYLKFESITDIIFVQYVQKLHTYNST
jgi:hypothetical protein